MAMRGCVLDAAAGFGFADHLCSSSACSINHEETTGEQHWSSSLVSPTLSGSTPPPPPAPSARARRDGGTASVRTLAGNGVGPEHPRPNLRAPRASNTATQRFIAESAAVDFAAEAAAANPYAVEPAALDPYAVEPAGVDPYLVEPMAADTYAVEPEELEAESVQPYPPPQPFAAEEPGSARMAKLILPPPPPQFSSIRRGERLLPERSNDPKYYPGLVNDPEPLPDLERKWPAWGKYAVAGVAVFIAGLIARGMLSGPPTWSAVIDVTPPDARVQVDGQTLEGSTSPRTREGLIAGDHVLLVEAPGFVTHRQVVTMSEADRRFVVSLDREPPPKKEEPIAEPAPAAPEPVAAAAAPAVAEPAPSPLEDISKLSKRELAKRRRSELRAARVAERYRSRKSGAAESSSAKSSAPVAASSKAAASGSTGLLKLNSTPWSEVYVDKKHVGHTPLLGLVLPAGRHTVELKNPDTGAKKKLRIKLKAGETLVKIEKLGR